MFKLIMVGFVLITFLFSLGCSSDSEENPVTEPLVAEDLEAQQKNETIPESLPLEEPVAIDNPLTGGAVTEQGETHFVDLTSEGFEPNELTIQAGDTVVWQNVRSGQISKAFVIGVRECAKIRSKILTPGESFSWTFEEPIKCTIVDGIMTTVESKIEVE
ncbi:MAG TPA: hypothetical protein VJA18_06240 [Candidatus Nanoarchaeia archaeon]|nr:hypothetical protein [Candidatus Nanoarchaeia archaeon]